MGLAGRQRIVNFSYMAEEWISAYDAREVLVRAGDPWAEDTLCSSAYDGLLRPWAMHLITNRRREFGVPVPRDLWASRGGVGLSKNWLIGEFEAVIRWPVHHELFDPV